MHPQLRKNSKSSWSKLIDVIIEEKVALDLELNQTESSEFMFFCTMHHYYVLLLFARSMQEGTNPESPMEFVGLQAVMPALAPLHSS